MRFKALDGWRGLAAILVALYHFHFFNHIHELSFIRNSFLFVDFFFVLSGFVIAYAYSKRLNNGVDIKKFIWRRIGRLWPLHIFVLLLFLGLEFLKLLIINSSGGWTGADAPFSGEYSISSFISNIFLVQSLGIHDSFTWNYPSWSISVEFYTYLVFVIVTLLFKTNFLVKLALIFTSLTIIYIYPHNLAEATYDYGIFRCVAGFFSGVITYNLFVYLKNKKLNLPYPTAFELLILTIVFLFVALLGNTNYTLLSPVLFAAMVFIFAYEGGFISKLLKLPFIQKIGQYSYSIYMIHAFLILVITRVIFLLEEKTNFKMYIPIDSPENPSNLAIFYIHNQYFMDLLTIGFIAVLLLLSHLTYHFVEKRGIKLFRNLEGSIGIANKQLKTKTNEL